MPAPQHRDADDIGVLLRDLKLGTDFRYLDLQRVEHAAKALAHWPLLGRLARSLPGSERPDPAASR